MKNLPKPRMNLALLPILLCGLMPGTLLAQNVLNMTGNPTATAIVAFSVRQLSTAYTGKCMQVRRSSDNTTQTIGFTTAGDLDTATLKTFVGTGTGYVSIWYDQSGYGLNAIQPTNADQPTIMVSGVINRDNGQPSVYTNGATGFLYYQPVTALNSTTTVTRMEVCRSRTGSFAIIEGLGYYQLDLQLFPTYVFVQYQTGNITITGSTMPSTTALMSINTVHTSGASQLYINTALQGTNTSTLVNLASPDTGFIGVRWDYAYGNAGPGAFSETILFSSVLSNADRQSINYNENRYYSLGFAPCSSTQDTLTPNSTTTKSLYACTLGSGPLWAYYYNPSKPLNLLFGIEKDPGNTGANSSFVADSVDLTATSNPSSVCYSATSGTEGIFALGRYWNVFTHTPLTSSVNVRFFYNPADTVAARAAATAFKTSSGAAFMSNIQWFKTVGDPFNQDSLTATPTATVKGPFINLTPVYGTLGGINYAEFDGVTSFSGGTGVYIVSNTMVTLPTVISSFTGRRVNQATVLSWATQSESNTDRFEIQRSTDGNTWLNVGQVPAAGNSSTPLSYQYIDTVAMQGGNGLYYRLHLVYKDGQDTYSGVVLIQASGNTVGAPQLNIVPNPFGSEIEITCTLPGSAPVEVQLLDITGAILMRQQYAANKGNNMFTLTNLGGLAQGTYVVRVVQAGTIGVGKVIKL